MSFKKNIKFILNFILKEKKGFYFFLALIVLGNILELIPNLILENLLNNAQLFTNNELTQESFVQILKKLGILALLVFFIEALIWTINTRVYHNLSQKIHIRYKEHMMTNILNLDYETFTEKKSGELSSLVNRGSSSFFNFLNAVRWNTISFFVQTIGAAILLYKLHIFLSISIIIYGIFHSFGNYKLAKIANDQSRVGYRVGDKINGSVIDYLTNIFQIKVLGQENKIKKSYSRKLSFYKTFGEILASKFGNWNFFGVASYGFFAVLIMSFSTILFLQGKILLGGLALTYTLFRTVSFVSNSFVRGLESVMQSSNQIEESVNLLKIEPKVIDIENAKTLKLTSGKIDFKDIHFKYKNKIIFDKFNLTIKPGETVALVGKSGSGKTTLINLLYRLYNLNKGKILIDDQDIKDIKQASLRSSMSLVPQDCMLFDDTIYNNIKFGSEKVTKGQIFNALKKAELNDFISNLSKREKTIVGERGIKLSGGEKQRVSLARAFLSNKKILIFDEPTSALDSETEADIQKAITNLVKDRTSIIIAHRLSTVMHADRIIVLDSGKIVEEGTHKQLLKKKGKYSELWKYQSEGFI